MMFALGDRSADGKVVVDQINVVFIAWQLCLVHSHQASAKFDRQMGKNYYTLLKLRLTDFIAIEKALFISSPSVFVNIN